MSVPDKLYDRSRDELTIYEDSEFDQILSNVPNFYISQTDQTIWGSLLRDVAAELGRLEYAHSYDIIGKDPKYLTPPDAKRQWSDPLFINRNYPQNDQYDLDYKNLVIGLIKAFQLGATPESIKGVIRAYTGQDIDVDELYKKINNGYYDATVRNMIKLAVRVGGTGVNDLITLDGATSTQASANISKLKTITDDLYGAIDLAKPAHVGLNLTTIFGLDEQLGQFIWGRYGITDELRIIAQMVESEPLPPPLYQAPFFDQTHPDTGLASTEVDNPLHSTFTPSGNPAPAPSDPRAGYTLSEFAAAKLSSTPGTVVTTGTPPPNPGVLSPMLKRVWEVADEQLDIMDMD